MHSFCNDTALAERDARGRFAEDVGVCMYTHCSAISARSREFK